MKRPLTILSIALLTMFLVYACSSTIRTANTSFVTITIGGNSQKATLHAEGATPLARLKYFLADAKLMPEAYAYIPSVVQVLVVTVSAADMTTPIVGIDSIKPDQTTATIRIEVPNGSARQFTVEGIRGVDSQIYYRGTATENLMGLDVTLPIIMEFVGPGILVDTLHSKATDTADCGTAALPCKTITYALNSRTTGTDAIIVSAGTYTAGESYPLQLKPGTALICTGTGYSTIIDVSTANATAIWGNDGAAVDNCMIKVGFGSNGIDDQAARTKINGTYIELSGSPSVPPIAGILLSNDSLLLESTVTGSNASLSVYGVQVNGGKPAIIGSTISNLPFGIDLASGAGDATISNSVIDSNSTGIKIATTGKPSISGSSITNNSTGLSIAAGNAEITTSTFTGNGTGILIDGGSPRIMNSEITGNGNTGISVAIRPGDSPVIQSNRIHCNYFYNLESMPTASIPAYDVTKNSWEHDPPLVSDQTSITVFCQQGDDICYNGAFGPAPNYDNFTTAVPGVCNRPVAKPR